jgi:hypothetical protein
MTIGPAIAGSAETASVAAIVATINFLIWSSLQQQSACGE